MLGDCISLGNGALIHPKPILSHLGFNSAYTRESCVDPDVIEPKTFFIDNTNTNSRVANRFQKLKLAINAFNKTKLGKPKSY